MLEGLNNTFKLVEERINKFEYSTIGITMYREQKEKTFRKMSRTSGTPVSITIYAYCEHQRMGKKGQRLFWKNNDSKLPKFDKTINVSIQTQWTPNKTNSEIHTYSHHSKTVKANDKERILKASKESNSTYRRDHQ